MKCYKLIKLFLFRTVSKEKLKSYSTSLLQVISFYLNMSGGWTYRHYNNIQYLNYLSRELRSLESKDYPHNYNNTIARLHLVFVQYLIYDLEEYIVCDDVYIHQTNIAKRLLKRAKNLYKKRKAMHV